MNALSIRHYGASHGSHSHDHFQILVGLHGTLELEVAGRGWRIDAGNGFVVPPGERHDFESREGSSCLVLDTGAAGWSRCPAQPRQTDVTLALARYLSVSLQAGQTQALQLAPALLLQAWGPAIGARPRRAIDWAALNRWAQTRAQQPLTVADLAGQVHLSPTQFATRCREETGQSAMQWLRSLRLLQARQLRAGGLGVAETARRCGYRSPSALTAALRRDASLH